MQLKVRQCFHSETHSKVSFHDIKIMSYESIRVEIVYVNISTKLDK